MTNLFYPSVVVWYQKRNPTPSRVDYQAGPSSSRIRSHYGTEHDDPLSVLSTPLLDSIFPDPPALLPRLSPSGWWYSDDSQEGPRWNITSVKNGEYHLGPIEDEEIRMVTIAWIDVDGALSWREDGVDGEDDHSSEARVISEAIRQRVEGWEKDHPGSRERCVRELETGSSGNVEAEGVCYLFSTEKLDRNSRSFSDVASSTSIVDSPGFYRSMSAIFRLPRTASLDFTERWKAVVGKISDEAGGQIFLDDKSTKDVSEECRLSVCPPSSVVGSQANFQVHHNAHLAYSRGRRLYRKRRESVCQILHHRLPRIVHHSRLPSQFRYSCAFESRSSDHWDSTTVLFCNHVTFCSRSDRVEWMGLVKFTFFCACLGITYGYCHCWRREYVYPCKLFHIDGGRGPADE